MGMPCQDRYAIPTSSAQSPERKGGCTPVKKHEMPFPNWNATGGDWNQGYGLSGPESLCGRVYYALKEGAKKVAGFFSRVKINKLERTQPN